MAKPSKKVNEAKAAALVGDMDIGLSSTARARVVDILNRLLADAFVLYAQARSFHWNVRGRNFAQDHALFESEYAFLDEVIDNVAERARILGGAARATLAHYVATSRLSETDAAVLTADQMIETQLAGHELIIRTLREDVETVDDLNDEGTTDFLTGLMEEHEKRAWMLRAHLGR